LFSWCVTRNINQKKEKPNVKTLIALALLAASIIGALAQTEDHDASTCPPALAFSSRSGFLR